MQIKFGNQNYTLIDTKEKITIADSFVVRQNKIGGGNGEAKFYIGQKNQKMRDFFGNIGFSINCFLVKQDLLKYLDATHLEYLHPQQTYINTKNLSELWDERRSKIEMLPEIIKFTVEEQTQISGVRLYIKSNDEAYNIIRELSLPNITYISVLKLAESNGNLVYCFRLFADYFGSSAHPSIVKEEDTLLNNTVDVTERLELQKARIGHGSYRAKLLKECKFCPITLVSDDRLLNASHIKPWSEANNFERLDPKNGFMFTPTIDRLFDSGFLSFTEDKKTILSPFLSPQTYQLLNLSDNTLIPYLPIEGREQYLDFHRTNILKR